MPGQDAMRSDRGRSYATIAVTPLAPTLAADVEAGDLRGVTDERFADIRRAWLAHHVIRFRGQSFTNADIVAFGRRFGEFQPNKPGAVPVAPDPTAEAPRIALARDPEHPQVSFISNLVENDTALGMLGDRELVWHTDQSSFEITPKEF